VGLCIGANNTPGNLQQYKTWIQTLLPGGQMVHIFGLAAICWAIWKSRNKACFDGKLIKNPTEILTHACAFMNYWAGLYASDFQEKLMDGVKVLLLCTHRVLAHQARPTAVLQLPAPPEDTEDEEDEQ
jgi:hypothetical protein